MYSALYALCQNGQLGPCKMMLLTGHHDGNNNLVAYKSVSSSLSKMCTDHWCIHRLQVHHNDNNDADAFPLNEDEELAMGNAWNDWCEARIPSE